MSGLWAADLPTSYESPSLLMALNFVFSTLVSFVVAGLAGGGFLRGGERGLLMLGCGMLVWGTASFAASAVAQQGANLLVTIDNLGVWFSALFWLVGALLALRSYRAVRRPGLWLAADYGLALGLVGLICLAAIKGWMPVFFVQGQGGTPLRQFVLGMAIGVFALTAGLMLAANRRARSRFLDWYAPGLTLLAAGLTGVAAQTVPGSALSWAGRATQYLGGAYMLLAALVSVREASSWGMSLEAALREAKQQFKELFDLAVDGIVVHELITETSRGNFLQANPAVCNLLGYTAEEMRELTPLDIMTPEDRQSVSHDIEKMTRDGVLRHEKTLIAKDGRRISAEISTRLFRQQGRPMVMSVIRDITERKQAEAAPSESEALYRAIGESIDYGV